MTPVTDLSIILVHHETLDKTLGTIRSVRNTARKFSYEIIVVDNSTNIKLSADKADKYISVENKGFANACNAGAKLATGEYLLFLNTDVELGKDVLDSALAYIKQDAKIGVLGLRTLLPDGTLDAGCMRGFPTPFASFCYLTKLDQLFPHNKYIGHYHMTYLNPLKTQEVECVSGAFMLMRRDFFETLGGWDERFFMYSEDIDLCIRAYENGKKVVYFADGYMIHYKGGSINQQNNQKLTDSFYNGMKLFYDKHYKNKYPRVVTWLVYLAINVKKSIAKHS